MCWVHTQESPWTKKAGDGGQIVETAEALETVLHGHKLFFSHLLALWLRKKYLTYPTFCSRSCEMRVAIENSEGWCWGIKQDNVGQKPSMVAGSKKVLFMKVRQLTHFSTLTKWAAPNSSLVPLVYRGSYGYALTCLNIALFLDSA